MGGGDTQARILIHQSQAGAVIGKAGYKIKELREGSFVVIFSNFMQRCCQSALIDIIEFRIQRFFENIYL